MKIIKFTISTVLIFICFTSFSQIKVLSSGNTQMGGSSAHTGATLNLYGVDEPTIRSDISHSFGWGDAIKSYVNRSSGIAYSAWYNGNRNFMVFGDGEVRCVDLYETSDSTLKENIRNLESALEKTKKLRGVKFNWKNYNPEDKKSTRDKIGLIAQEVEQIIPEVIQTSPEGEKAIAYSKIVPFLIESIKELEARIETLENDCCHQSENLKSGSLKSSKINSEVNEAKLYQNAPNPFNVQATIRFEIPESVQNAQLHICNMTGTLLKTIKVNQRGPDSVIISANEFNAGMYLYSLVCDGKIVDTKQMLLTE